ncbi:hypothetical protein JMJ35_003171 [Cladonia borealis]|uniref:Uncharacterized protein n=1 Tax=Cladonia borealis TaxID=184061 RepID=A0AA39R6D2_9LECA|nr:hypothetical protein JMJ35_003171 [Cladonia borealis]
MAAMALARENSEVRTQIDNLSVVASVVGSMDYQNLYQELQAYYVKLTLVIDDSLPVKVKSHLVEDESPLVEDEPPLLKEMNQEPPSQRLQNIFLQQLRNIQQCAERNLRQHVRISAISLPSYWYEGPKRTVLGAATQLNINIPTQMGMNIPGDMLLCHEETARLAYNLESLKKGSWFLVFVEYNSKNLYLTIAEMSDREDPEFHPKYPVDGRYLLKDLGEASPTRCSSGNIFTNLRPSHVMALGTARAVRSKRVNGDILRDVYEPVAIED